MHSFQSRTRCSAYRIGEKVVGENFRHQKLKFSSPFPDEFLTEEKIWKIEIYVYIFLAFRWENYSSGNYSSGNYSSGKIIRREKLFVGKNYSSGKIIRREKLFVAERFVTKPKFRHSSPTTFSQIRYLFDGIYSGPHMVIYNYNNSAADRYRANVVQTCAH